MMMCSMERDEQARLGIGENTILYTTDNTGQAGLLLGGYMLHQQRQRCRAV